MPRLYNEPFRPRIHFSPPRNFMNDPNGLIYYKGVYHLFFQFNPSGNQWGHMNWGHAVSKDLLHWKNLPVAIPEENNISIFSGSAIQDTGNSSGLGNDTEEILCAIYTGNHNIENWQTQNLAFSLDGGYKWFKYKKNPILDISARQFRDPKVFWYGPGEIWIMVVALADEKIVQFYSSKNLLNWKYLSRFGPAGKRDTTYWECPDLFELIVDADPSNKRWILKIDFLDKSNRGESGSQYFIGQFNGTTFLNENSSDEVLRVDYGKDFYAAQTFSNLPDKERRTLWLAWMNNWQYANDTPTDPWRGNMTIPRELFLNSTAHGLRLYQRPIFEINSLRRGHLKLEKKVIAPDQVPLDKANLPFSTYELFTEFEIVTASQFGFRIRESQEFYTKIGFDVHDNRLFLDRRNSGSPDFHPDFPDIHYAPLELLDQKRLKLHIIVDVSCVEIFANEGARVITDLIFPQRESNSISLFSEGGLVKLISLELNSLQ